MLATTVLNRNLVFFALILLFLAIHFRSISSRRFFLCFASGAASPASASSAAGASSCATVQEQLHQLVHLQQQALLLVLRLQEQLLQLVIFSSWHFFLCFGFRRASSAGASSAAGTSSCASASGAASSAGASSWRLTLLQNSSSCSFFTFCTRFFFCSYNSSTRLLRFGVNFFRIVFFYFLCL